MQAEYMRMKDLSGIIHSLQGSGRPIAIVDDDDDDRDFMKKELRFMFGETPVLSFRRAADLSDYLLHNNDPARIPALILLDLHMPGMDGFMTMEYLRRLRSACDIPVVAISGTREKADISAAIRFGASAFLPKPLRRSDFIQAFFPKTPASAAIAERP